MKNILARISRRHKRQPITKHVMGTKKTGEFRTYYEWQGEPFSISSRSVK